VPPDSRSGMLLRLFRQRGEIEGSNTTGLFERRRAKRELGFTPRRRAGKHLRSSYKAPPEPNLECWRNPFDDWGMDAGYIHSMSWLLDFLRKTYWRIECEWRIFRDTAGRFS
jgi:hypothetical protein